MSILQELNDYDIENVYFCDSIKNNIMSNGNFIRILYCMPNFTMNGVHIHIQLNNIVYEKYYQKYKCFFDVEHYADLVTAIHNIETEILNKLPENIKKTPQYKITEQLQCGFLKIFSESVPTDKNASFMLKISGIWDTESSYGLTYKFTKMVSVS